MCALIYVREREEGMETPEGQHIDNLTVIEDRTKYKKYTEDIKKQSHLGSFVIVEALISVQKDSKSIATQHSYWFPNNDPELSKKG